VATSSCRVRRSHGERAVGGEEGASYAARPQQTASSSAATTSLPGVLACGGRHVAPAGDVDSDVDGWVEKRCRSCLDSGLPEQQAS
jgi:hypothetical protein